MAPVTAIQTGFRKSLSFSERASRPEFWWFAPVYFGFILSMITTETPKLLFSTLLESLSVLQLIFLFLIVLLVPLYSSFWRRLNDTEISAKLLLLIPIYLVLAPSIALIVDQSEQFGIRSPSKLMPEAMYVAYGYLGLIVLAFLLCLTPSQPGSNKFGPNPNEVPS